MRTYVILNTKTKKLYRSNSDNSIITYDYMDNARWDCRLDDIFIEIKKKEIENLTEDNINDFLSQDVIKHYSL